MSGTLKPVTHRVNGRQSANVVQSVSVCGPSFEVCPTLLALVRPVLLTLQLIEHVESAAEL